jgi:hypothetical protein
MFFLTNPCYNQFNHVRRELIRWIYATNIEKISHFVRSDRMIARKNARLQDAISTINGNGKSKTVAIRWRPRMPLFTMTLKSTTLMVIGGRYGW